ncbi:HNH endonuclease [Chondrinema litorale]|uniref:HNH endonuclease n=1 Tax=Chondrinema litorale TaxID=2994555 RepID=UPI0025430A12|nr:HNH endonuclease signature motif containing protein [Chondrinema litorale]UZR95305.1 HNH endonuclease signature motif containing protein [Chondrinema litorale]
MKLDNFKRYQNGLTLDTLFPKLMGVCACGCANKLEGRRKKWYSDECRKKALFEFYIIKGDPTFIRKLLFEIDKGFCRSCGSSDEEWEADHIIPVTLGGGACGLDNYQTLCKHCHIEKSKLDTIPNSSYVFTSRFNIICNSYYRIRAD